MSGLFYNYPLRTCCFCLTLKTGCRLIGSLSTFICTMQLVYACQRLNALLERGKHCFDDSKWENPISDDNHYNPCSHLKAIQLTLIIDFIIFIIGFNGSVMLLYGIKSKQPKLFWGWLVFCGLVIFSNFLFILVWHNMRIVVNFLVVIILSYLFRVVRSYYIELMDEREGRAPPVVAVSFPTESGSQIFFPGSHRRGARPPVSAEFIKDDPPPPYPGLSIPSSCSVESQPPPYSAIDDTHNTRVEISSTSAPPVAVVSSEEGKSEDHSTPPSAQSPSSLSTPSCSAEDFSTTNGENDNNASQSAAQTTAEETSTREQNQQRSGSNSN